MTDAQSQVSGDLVICRRTVGGSSKSEYGTRYYVYEEVAPYKEPTEVSDAPARGGEAFDDIQKWGIPPDVVKSARGIEKWFAERGIENWTLLGIQKRSSKREVSEDDAVETARIACHLHPVQVTDIGSAIRITVRSLMSTYKVISRRVGG